jgi:hypothetical protein
MASRATRKTSRAMQTASRATRKTSRATRKTARAMQTAARAMQTAARAMQTAARAMRTAARAMRTAARMAVRMARTGASTARTVIVSEKAAALGGVGPRHARRLEAADRWSSLMPAWSLVTERALVAPMKHRSFPHGHAWAGRARWPEAEDGRGGPRQDSRRRAFSTWSLWTRDAKTADAGRSPRGHSGPRTPRQPTPRVPKPAYPRHPGLRPVAESSSRRSWYSSSSLLRSCRLMRRRKDQ